MYTPQPVACLRVSRHVLYRSLLQDADAVRRVQSRSSAQRSLQRLPLSRMSIDLAVGSDNRLGTFCTVDACVPLTVTYQFPSSGQDFVEDYTVGLSWTYQTVYIQPKGGRGTMFTGC